MEKVHFCEFLHSYHDMLRSHFSDKNQIPLLWFQCTSSRLIVIVFIVVPICFLEYLAIFEQIIMGCRILFSLAHRAPVSTIHCLIEIMLYQVLKHQQVIDELTEENEKLRHILVEDLKVPPSKLQAHYTSKIKYPCSDCFECRRKQRRR